MDIENRIRDYVATHLLFSPSGYPYPDDASFLKEGIVDSIGVMELVTFVQSSFGITVDPVDIVPEHFDSVSRLAAFVRKRQAAS